MTSKVSIMSSCVSASGAASGVTPTPPVPESRSRGESFRSRTDSAKSRPHSPLPQVLEGGGMTEEEKQNLDPDVEKEEMDVDGRQPLHASSKRLTVMKDRTMLMDSEASVYTQNSSRLSDAHQPTRPAALNLTQQPSPLLHTSWGSGPSSSAVGSGFVYPNSSKSSSMAYTPVPGIVSQLQVRQGTANDGHGSPSLLPSPITPNFASAMCMMIEDGRNKKSGVVSEEEKSLDMTQESSGLGNRIVVKDEDELPSRILNNSFNDTLPSTLEHTPEASCSSSPSVSMHLRHVDRNLSPSPEPVLQHRLAPPIVTNRTPSPLPSVAETFPSDPPSPLVPTNPPLSDSSPTPPPTQILPTYSSSSTPTQQPPSHLRPPKPNANGSSFPEQNRRRSIFLPHPNALKPLGVVQGAQGIAPGQSQMGPSGPQPPPPQQHMGQQGPPPRPHLFGVIHMALLMPPRPLAPPSQPPPRPGQLPQQQPCHNFEAQRFMGERRLI